MSILILDCSNLLHRVYWISRKHVLTNSKGEDVGCIFKFLKSTYSLSNRFQPQEFYAAWDKKEDYGQANFRSTLTEGTYKAGRNKEEQSSVYENETKLIPLISSLGIKNLFPKILEADDVIAWITEKLKATELITIVSSDKDFLQLVQPNVQVYSPAKDIVYNIKNFKTLIGIEPTDYLKFKALTGDTADNLKIDCLSGIGPKTAIKIINKEKTLSPEQITAASKLQHLMDLKQGFIEHPDDVTFCEAQFEKLKSHKADMVGFKKFCEENDFNSILNSFSNWRSTYCQSRLTDLIASLS